MTAEDRARRVLHSAEELQRELEDTRALLAVGHTLADISARRPGVLIGLAHERPLTDSEATALRRWFEVLEAELEQVAAERDLLRSERSWAEQQRRNAAAWSRLCAELGNQLGRLAEGIGEPGLEQDPALLVARVLEELSCRS